MYVPFKLFFSNSSVYIKINTWNIKWGQQVPTRIRILGAIKYAPSRKGRFHRGGLKRGSKSKRKYFSFNLGTVLCSAAFSNGDNKRPQSRYSKSHRDLHHLHKSNLFNNNLRAMRETDQKNGNPSVARRPMIVLKINQTYQGKVLGNMSSSA